MAFIASNKEFEKVFYDKTMTGLFMKKLKDYLERHSDRFPYNELLECLNNNEGLSVFACREDVSDEMYMALLSAGIPCLRIATADGRTGFIAAFSNIEKIAEAQRKVLTEKQLAVRTNVLTGEQLINGMLDPEQRDVTIIRGLSKTEAYRLMTLAHEKLFLKTCAIDEMKDHTFCFSLYRNDALKAHDKVTLSQLYIQVQMELLGPYGEEVREKTERMIEMNRLIGYDFDIEKYNQGRKVFITGDKNTFMIIDEKRFDYGHIKERDGQRTYVTEVTSDYSKYDYFDNLRSYAMRIRNPRVFRDRRQLDQAELRDLSKSNQEIRYDIAIGNVIKKVGEMLIDRSREDPDIFLYGNPTEILRNTVRESAKILLSAAGGNCPYEYTTEQIEKFRTVVAENRLNLVPFKSSFMEMAKMDIIGKSRPLEQSIKDPSRAKGDGQVYEPDVPQLDPDELKDMWGHSR